MSHILDQMEDIAKDHEACGNVETASDYRTLISMARKNGALNVRYHITPQERLAYAITLAAGRPPVNMTPRELSAWCFQRVDAMLAASGGDVSCG